MILERWRYVWLCATTDSWQWYSWGSDSGDGERPGHRGMSQIWDRETVQTVDIPPFIVGNIHHLLLGISTIYCWEYPPFIVGNIHISQQICASFCCWNIHLFIVQWCSQLSFHVHLATLACAKMRVVWWGKSSQKPWHQKKKNYRPPWHG